MLLLSHVNIKIVQLVIFALLEFQCILIALLLIGLFDLNVDSQLIVITELFCISAQKLFVDSIFDESILRVQDKTFTTATTFKSQL